MKTILRSLILLEDHAKYRGLELDVYQIRIISALVMLIAASTLDVWKREVHDLLWIIFGAIAIILIFVESFSDQVLTEVAFSLIIAPIALVLWRMGLFGGADAFCLIVLATLAPQLTLTENFVTPLTTLTNAAFISIVILLVNFIRNLIAILNHRDVFAGFDENKFRKICAMFLGYRSTNPKYGFSIEKSDGVHKKLDFAIHHAEKTEFCKTKDTWVTPGIPFIIYITAGFVVQLIFGDIIINAITTIL
ncbi:MAG: A24 family peptidase C-terminal domain-containing protein [Thermoproteota archaeon]